MTKAMKQEPKTLATVIVEQKLFSGVWFGHDGGSRLGGGCGVRVKKPNLVVCGLVMEIAEDRVGGRTLSADGSDLELGYC